MIEEARGSLPVRPSESTPECRCVTKLRIETLCDGAANDAAALTQVLDAVDASGWGTTRSSSSSPAVLSVLGAASTIPGMDPLDFAITHEKGPRVVDQVAGTTAGASVRAAARRDEPTPLGWPVDPDGKSTTDAHSAMTGAPLPFGGTKGASIAMMIEVLAAIPGGAVRRGAASGLRWPR